MLEHSCGSYAAFGASIHRDLLPWAEEGISAPLAGRALDQHSVAGGPGGRPSGVGMLFSNATLYVLARPEALMAEGVGAELLVYVTALIDLVRAFGRALPPVEFVVAFRDNPGEALFGQPGGGPPVPVLNYCGAEETADILIPYNGIYYEAAQILSILDGGPSARPWAQRADEAFGHYTIYEGRYSATPSTARLDAEGKPLAVSPRRYITDWAAALPPGLNVSLGAGDRRQMADWAASRYVVHLDGLACSAKLEKARPPSHMRSFASRLDPAPRISTSNVLKNATRPPPPHPAGAGHRIRGHQRGVWPALLLPRAAAALRALHPLLGAAPAGAALGPGLGPGARPRRRPHRGRGPGAGPPLPGCRRAALLLGAAVDGVRGAAALPARAAGARRRAQLRGHDAGTANP